tara:strand:- start:635 stop:1006 length:372 start_codon:yes stop_codon:yes gene_type:complete
MKINKTALTLIGLSATCVAFASAAETIVTADELSKAGLRVSGYILESITEPVCANPVYDQWDIDKDGVLDQICVGLKYDVCEVDGVATAYFDFSVKGGVCSDIPVSPVCVPAGDLTTGAPVCP